MFSKDDIKAIEERGSSVKTIEAQVERFKKGFPWMDIVGPATPERGIKVMSEEEADKAVAYYDNASVAGKCKFVPASGAASRMFKDIFAGLSALENGSDPGADSLVGKLVPASRISLSILRRCSVSLRTMRITAGMLRTRSSMPAGSAMARSRRA